MIKCQNSCPLGKFEGCCYSCPEMQTCKESCSEVPEQCQCSTFDEESGLAVFEQKQIAVLQQIASIVRMKKQCEEQEKELKDQLKQAMEQYGVKKFESDILNITYIAESTKTSIDSAKLKKKYPEIASECSKVSPTSAYIKVEVKDDKE